MDTADDKIFVYGDELTFRIREEELDRQLLSSPVTLAQRVEVELIRNLKRNAPWLLEYGSRYSNT